MKKKIMKISCLSLTPYDEKKNASFDNHNITLPVDSSRNGCEILVGNVSLAFLANLLGKERIATLPNDAFICFCLVGTDQGVSYRRGSEADNTEVSIFIFLFFRSWRNLRISLAAFNLRRLWVNISLSPEREVSC